MDLAKNAFTQKCKTNMIAIILLYFYVQYIHIIAYFPELH